MGKSSDPINKLRVVSLFSGIGGMDLGIQGGFKYLGKRYSSNPVQLVMSTDFDIKAANIFNANFEHTCLVADITKLGSEDFPDHDVLLGGFPCQSFSVAATNPPRLGYKDLRGQLFFEMVRILREKKPRVFIAENVKGLLSANSGAAFPLILQEFEAAGYHVTWKILNSAHYGVPQKRERVFMVGFRSESALRKFEFPRISSPVPVQLGGVLESDVDEKYFFSERAVAGMKSSKNSHIMNKGRAQRLDGPCNTVGAHLAKVSLNSTDPVLLINGRYRMFTPREVARIQSFPDDYVLEGAKSALYRGLGNAVAPVVMWHLTKSVIRALEPS